MYQQPLLIKGYNHRKTKFLLTILAIFSCFFVVAGNSVAASLKREQMLRAHALADQLPWPSATLKASHPLGLQTLSIEKQERKNSPATRWVNVYQYHYEYQSARLVLVDLRDEFIAHQTMITSVHLPLNQTEINFVITLIANDVTLVNSLKTEQQYRGQTPFSTLDELDIKASIFEPLDNKHPCAIERCALVSMFDQTRTVFSIEPVVLLNSFILDILGSP